MPCMKVIPKSDRLLTLANIESLSPERSLFPEGSDESGSAAHATQGAPCSLAELPIICRTNIRKFVLLPVAPDVFHRIQFGSVGGKILDLDSAVGLVDLVWHEAAAVGLEGVPE